MDPLTTYKAHTAIVEVRRLRLIDSQLDMVLTRPRALLLPPQDVAWHCLQENTFATVGDDRQLMLSVMD